MSRLNRTVSVAPMMDCTDKHERFFLRLISKNVLLYTEMIVSEAIDRGDKKKLLEFDMREKPVALQLGGSSPKLLGNAAYLGEEFGYDEINLNLGCPSKKVQKNRFGACLIQEPNLVADCLSEMISKTSLPVTVKTRIGCDNVDQYENLYNFVNILKETGVNTFIIHARKAMLGKFTPKQNLNIPPLKYEYVNRLKKDFQDLEIIINGGITSTDQIKEHLDNVDGVMIGRSIYQNPYSLVEIEKEIFNVDNSPTREEVVQKLLEYLDKEVKEGTKVNHIMRHTVGLYHGQVGSKEWKRYLSDNMMARDSDFQKAKHIMTIVQNNEKANQVSS